MSEIIVMPDSFMGRNKPKTDCTHTTPREWTDNEVDWVLRLSKEGFTARQIAHSTRRSVVSVATKLKRLKKFANTYNQTHLVEKYKINREFLDCVKPSSVLDLYCGRRDFYSAYPRVTNDIDKSIPADHHDDALRLLCKLYCDNRRFDLIDLDPFGSAYDCFDLALKMVNTGLAITFGEMGHQRWRRFDFVKDRYGIHSMDEFTVDKMIAEVLRIASTNKKSLEIFRVANWRNISRVWFIVGRKNRVVLIK